MKSLNLCILGGTGFVGHHLTWRLARDGHRIRLLTRHPQRHRDLLLNPGVELLAAEGWGEAGLAEAFAGCDAVVNLVGILNEAGNDGSGFRHAHVELPRRIVGACRRAGVARLLHMSALGASPAGPSHYLRSKAEGEALVLGAEGIAATVFRPAVIFGPGDSFLNRFAALLRTVPWLFPLACPEAQMQPVFVGDVTAAFARALALPATIGERYDLCGPRRYSLRQVVEYVARELGLRRRVVGLGDGMSRLQARVMDHLPGKPFSTDNYLSLQQPSVCDGPFPPVFGITPTTLEAVAPDYLRGSPRLAAFDQLRRSAGRRE